MDETVGNESCRQAMQEVVEKARSGVFFVYGPWGLGKRTFLERLIAAGDRGISVPSTVDGIRSIRAQMEAAPVLEDVHDAVIVDSDRMSIPAQDACLKLLEEPPSDSRIWIHASDPMGIGRALSSRKRAEFRWFPVARDEMEKWAATFGNVDSTILDIAAGRPGCYLAMRADPRFLMFHAVLIQAVSGSKNLLLDPLPALLSELDGDSPLREPVYLTICHVAKSNVSKAPPLLAFASKVLSHPSLNTELHWFAALDALRG